ncbi:207_t:CDS:2, partial [Dentiscutata erythropus]
IVLLTFANLGSSQTPLSEQFENSLLSPQCLNNLLSLFTNPNVLIAIKNYSNDPRGNFQNLVPPLINFATIICSLPKCNDTFIQKSIQSVSDGCSNSSNQKSEIIPILFPGLVFYSPLHDSICFKDNKAEFCWIDSAAIIYGNSFSTSDYSDTFYKPFCTLCNKAIVNTFFNLISTSENAQKLISNKRMDITLIKKLIAVIYSNSFVGVCYLLPL